MRSPPIRGCGLKLASHYSPAARLRVTPHTGVWIETVFEVCNCAFEFVTPHTGVWIETLKVWGMICIGPRHPPYGGVD